MWQWIFQRHPASVAPAASDAPVGATPSAEQQTWGARLRGALSTGVVVALLAGVAAWGHFQEWRLPSLSAVVGKSGPAEPLWCDAHNVPESGCIECNAELVAPLKSYGWCEQHGLMQCVLEHPDLAQLAQEPAVESADLERAQRALALRPRVENNSRCPTYERRIQFASQAAMEKAGVDIAIAVRRPVIEAVPANGEVVYDQTHSAHLASRVSGTAWRVERQVGDRVRKGDVLALIDAAEVGRAKSELLQAISQLRLREANLARLSPLAGDGTV
ncbi:MAG: efflux RND transporter periplasmic adaptor subunit, partial [Planctomycetaceae bacterium]|nr:efflux RND transporter periplasmic adaptor subunit [Planctomycetaceae bacterium]